MPRKYKNETRLRVTAFYSAIAFLSLILTTVTYKGPTAENNLTELEEQPRGEITSEPIAREVITSANAINYSQLSEDHQNLISKYCCSYSSNGNWMAESLVEFEPINSYFVEAEIDSEMLAKISLKFSCGGATYVQECSEKEALEKAEDILNDSQLRRLYGKYMLDWVFFSGEKEIPSTTKFTGHSILWIERSSDNTKDHLIIGPLPEKPDFMSIKLHHNLTDDGIEFSPKGLETQLEE